MSKLSRRAIAIGATATLAVAALAATASGRPTAAVNRRS